MARVKPTSKVDSLPASPPPMTLEAAENEMVSLARNLVRQRLIDGTATSQETTFYLKLGTTEAILKRENLIEENKLLRAKTDALERDRVNAVKYDEILKALREYNGQGDDSDY